MNESAETRICQYCERTFETDPAIVAQIGERFCCVACHDAVELPEKNSGKPMFVSLETIENTLPELPAIQYARELDESVKQAFGIFILYRRIFTKLSAVEQSFVDWFFDHPKEPLQNFATSRGVTRESARQVMDSIRIKWPAFALCWPKKKMHRFQGDARG